MRCGLIPLCLKRGNDRQVWGEFLDRRDDCFGGRATSVAEGKICVTLERAPRHENRLITCGTRLGKIGGIPGPQMRGTWGTQSQWWNLLLGTWATRRLMNEYVRYYHEDRTHLGLEKQTPAGRATATSTSPNATVVSMPRLSGLHHRYDLAA
jgi:hypothetical protein